MHLFVYICVTLQIYVYAYSQRVKDKCMNILTHTHTTKPFKDYFRVSRVVNTFKYSHFFSYKLSFWLRKKNIILIKNFLKALFVMVKNENEQNIYQ